MGSNHNHYKIGYGFHPESGYWEKTDESFASDFRFRHAYAGDRLVLRSAVYGCSLYLYRKEVEESYLYTYCYQKEENWAVYSQKIVIGKTEGMEEREYIFQEECFFRISLQRCDRQVLKQEEETELRNAVFLQSKERQYQPKPYFEKEAELTADTVRDKKTAETLAFALLTDTHYVINGTWDDTKYNLKNVYEKVGYDGIIHLGDITDGMIPLEITKEYAELVMGDIRRIPVPFYLCLGNHDSNYFFNNPEKMNDEEQCSFYLNREKSYYYHDFTGQKLRCLFLTSFDYQEKVRYGFPEEEVEWVAQILEQTPEDYSVLVFAHVPPLPVIHYWSDEIRNGEELINVLEKYDSKPGGHVMAFIHGHNHAEQIYGDRRFPIISIGCNKTEYFTDKKPEGSYTCERSLGTVTQDLWDVMLVNVKEQRLNFIRFGAGKDRMVECRKKTAE